MRTLVLAAGYATRLYPLTKNQPKPLLEVAGKPMIDYILDRVMALKGMEKAYVVTNDKFCSPFEQWRKGHPFEGRLEIVNDGTTSEDDRLGAIGDLHFVMDSQNIDDDLLVIAGDNLFELSLDEFLDFCRKKQHPCLCAKDLSHRKDLLPKYGVLTLDEHHRVTHFVEKPPEPPSHFISMGVYFFPKQDLALLQKYVDEGQKLDAPGFFIQWLYQQTQVYAFPFRGEWYDIGDIKSLEEARELYGKKLEN